MKPLLLAVPLLALALHAAPRAASPGQDAPSISPTQAPWGWSVQLRTDRAFYLYGETAEVEHTLLNFTREDAFGIVPIKGGNGCNYVITVEDIAGRVVWRPGSIVNGEYQGPGCLFGSTWMDLSHGREIGDTDHIPLVYQNGGGLGTLGAPLDPGVYTMRIVVYFMGPQRRFDGEPGLHFEAAVPIRIEG